ncbi:MAG TPA: Ku protein [Acidimicrobiales bacterium]|nr:Ku protein [Acidimicrobiales bacterium]
MARSIWGGAISFGLVNVPVKLYTAVRKKDVRFHQLHAADGARINQKRVCSEDGDEVAYEDIVKGYEIAKGQYVIIEPDELDSLDPETTHTIDIEDFVQLDQIDPLFFDASYYVLPDARGEKAYRLLLEAMRDSGKVGIAKVVMRSKQYLVAVRPVGEALVMSTMNFADEVVTQDELDGLPGPSENVSDRELKMASQLIDSLSTDFDAARYEDTYREKVLELIEKKAEGQEIVAPKEAKATTPVVDLMAALEASLAAAKGESTTKSKSASKKDGAEETKAGRKAS